MKIRERAVSDLFEKDEGNGIRGVHESWVNEFFPKYWRKIVVKPNEGAHMMTYREGKLLSGHAQGVPHHHLIYPPTVGSLTIRMGYVEFRPREISGRTGGGFHWHLAEECFFYLAGKGAMDIEVEPGVIERYHYEAGDGLMVPFGRRHGQFPTSDETVKAVFAFGPRLRPFEPMTEVSIDYREFEEF